MFESCPSPLHGILPPYLIDRLSQSSDKKVRQLGIDAKEASATLRTQRLMLATLPAMAAIPSPAGTKHRLVYDAKHGSMWSLPGKLVRSEGDKKSKDTAANEAYDHSGRVYDFYRTIFARNSLDGNGMELISSVHLGNKFNNAFWNGEQMAYGDGDGSIFVRFTKSLDVVAHELTHGVITHTCNLEYRNESGALNEHFADVMGVLVAQWRRKQTVKQAAWTVGAEIMGPGTSAKCLRTFKNEPAYQNDPILGDDPQPKHLRDKYTGAEDEGGVHINSGIPNYAFYLVAMSLGGRAWERAGQIWYKTMCALTAKSDFAQIVKGTEAAAFELFGAGASEQKAVQAAWKAVGF
ncbi:MAG TPA: M4 family metallopeptidase [bacterium]